MAKLPCTEVYCDASGDWRWRYRARNGKVAASSGEAFSSKSNAKRAARRIGFSIGLSTIIEVQPYVLEGDYRRV